MLLFPDLILVLSQYVARASQSIFDKTVNYISIDIVSLTVVTVNIIYLGIQKLINPHLLLYYTVFAVNPPIKHHTIIPKAQITPILWNDS